MKTVQEYLRQADRERLLDAMAYDALSDTIMLLECKDMTVEQIQDACRKQTNDLIQHLLSIEAVPSDHMVLYLMNASSFDRGFGQADKCLCLIDLNEVRQDIYASSYAFDLTDWKETLGYLVAENKLTQDYMIDLLSQYLNELSFFGTAQEISHNCSSQERIQSSRNMAGDGFLIVPCACRKVDCRIPAPVLP